MTKIPRFLIAACTVLMVACGASGSNNPPEGATPSGEQYTIIFENTQYEDVAVAIIFEAAGPRRLGRVTGVNTERWRVPARSAAFVIHAAFMGGLGEYETDPIVAAPGDTITIVTQSTGDLVYKISR
jgi:hypothetical protein